MPLETGTYINSLNASNPVGASDPKSQGDDHLRLIKSTILATFPNITGQVTLTHAQINDAAQKAVSNTFTGGTQTISAVAPQWRMTETDGAANNKNWSITVDGEAFSLRAWDDAFSANQQFLTVNRTLNAIDDITFRVASGAAALQMLSGGAVGMYYNGILRFETQSDGARVRGAGTTDPTTGGSHDCELNLWNETPALLAQIGFPNAGTMEIRNRVHGSSIIIAAEDTGGTLRQLADFVSNAGVTLRYIGADRLLTMANGQVYIRSDTSPGIGSAQNTSILFQDDAGANLASVGFLSGATLNIINYNHGGPIALISENNAGVSKNLFIADPDAAATVYHTGLPAIATHSAGAHVYSPLDDNPFLTFYQDDLATRNAYIQGHSTSGLLIVNEVHGAPVLVKSEDNSGTLRTLFSGDPDGLTEITGRTQVSLICTTGSGGDLLGNSLHVDTDNLAADEIGYKGVPQLNKTANYTLVLTDAGKQIYLTGSTAAQTITIPANASVAFPIGTVVEIISDATVNWSIAITTDTLEVLGTGTTGTRTLATGGKAVLEKVTATKWKISGINLS